MRTAISTAVKLLAIAVVGGTSQLAARSSESTNQWEYRVLTKAQVLDLGKTDLAVGLNKLGDEGWELAAIDTAYIFKRPKVQKLAEVVKLRLRIAESDVEQQRERVQWAQRMLKKGFLSANELKEETRLLKELEIALAEAEEDVKKLPPEPKKPTGTGRKPEK
jgi:hypothetical protein